MSSESGKVTQIITNNSQVFLFASVKTTKFFVKMAEKLNRNKMEAKFFIFVGNRINLENDSAMF